MSRCPECGAEITPRMKFCAECGTRLAQAQSTVSYAPSFGDEEAEETAGTHGVAEGAALIELDQVEDTADRRMHVIGEEAVTVGRGPEGDIFLDDVTVARQPAETLRREDGREKG